MTRCSARLLARWAGALLVLGMFAALAAAPARAEEPAADVGERVLVVGVPGLSWSDVGETSVPVLWRLAGEGAVGSLTVRTVRSRTCEVDGWLTLSAGRRAADAPGPCREPGTVVDGRVAGWDRYLAAAAAASYGAHPGTLAERLDAVGACVSADGDAAAVGAADPQGRVTEAQDCAVELRSVAPLPVGARRAEALRALNRELSRIVSDPGSRGRRLLVAGLADGEGPVRPRAVVLVGQGVERGVLTSPSTRQPGLVQLQDLTASLLAGAGVDDAGLTGRPVVVEPDDRPVADRVADRVGFESRSATLRDLSPQVTGWLAAAFALWCVGVGVAWWRRPGVRVPGTLAAAGVAIAAVPSATFVANLVPWWHAGWPGAAFTGVLVVVVAGMTGAALLAGRRWRHGALVVVAVLTLLVLGGDVLTGSGLQLASVFGQNPTVGGRFYGVGNTSYAVLGVAVLTVVALLAAWRRPGRRWAVALAGLVLLATTVLEGHPSYGADFGGPRGCSSGPRRARLGGRSAADRRSRPRRGRGGRRRHGVGRRARLAPGARGPHPPRRVRADGRRRRGRRRHRPQARAEPDQPRVAAPAGHGGRDGAAGRPRLAARPPPGPRRRARPARHGGARPRRVRRQRLGAGHPGLRGARARAAPRRGRAGPGGAGAARGRRRVSGRLRPPAPRARRGCRARPWGG
ncbi:hypothetical protein G7075_02765 [Phycicoccus sp. HDW14]|uniref:hypothetical protein n=1 Tax=Phycicoccus sp. HDW14 TaxID=2714941 RepID=UPI00140A9FD8|nr:hypothetical protein [Phycicoccus sp. HDW14]QIM20316.1 hypothetical protein G7075_02765 [Phycicoccus sp. HDW14]